MQREPLRVALVAQARVILTRARPLLAQAAAVVVQIPLVPLAQVAQVAVVRDLPQLQEPQEPPIQAVVVVVVAELPLGLFRN